MMRVYRKVYGADLVAKLVPLKPTGKWMIKTINGESFLYLEHQGWIFKSWWHEDYLVVQDESIYIGQCEVRR